MATDSSPFRSIRPAKEQQMSQSELAECIGVSRVTIHRWSIGLLDGLPRIVLMALKEQKLTFDDIKRYRGIDTTLAGVMAPAVGLPHVLSKPSAAPYAPEEPYVPERKPYVDMHGIKRDGYGNVVPTPNPLASWRRSK